MIISILDMDPEDPVSAPVSAGQSGAGSFTSLCVPLLPL